ncbi:class I SAM-dependent methyltransferase [Actinomadura parmotrematis]|uniref:class I SAM-dependent methyltransferase n=1 Tax=Actinomadura parmotrematis TaxID=2864039 RepID=UPI0027E38967|nr:methyltransferase domain-containing protein [Actinomadura parmotrematis]
MAESFGIDAERYDRTRPRYPAAMVERVAAAAPGRSVLDVGCGTGIASRQFQDAGCAVLGVEPDARMAAFARRRGLEVEVATFEEWEPAGRAFDAVIAAQSWHWIDPAAGAAKAAGVLRPGGRLALFWNVFALPDGVAAAIADVCERVMPGAPFDFRAMAKGGALRGYEAGFGRAAGGIRGTGAFGEPERWDFAWSRTYTRDELLDMMPTQGAFTRLPPDGLAEVLAGAGAAVDEAGGAVDVDYTAGVVTATRTEP